MLGGAQIILGSSKFCGKSGFSGVMGQQIPLQARAFNAIGLVLRRICIPGVRETPNFFKNFELTRGRTRSNKCPKKSFRGFRAE